MEHSTSPVLLGVRLSDIEGLAVSDSGIIATASSAGNVRVWSAERQLLADIPIRPDDAPDVAFATGSDTLYYEDANDVIRRLDLEPTPRFNGPAGS